MKERFYDRLNGALDRNSFGERRDRLVGSLTGDVLEIGAGTGLNLPRYRRVARLVAIELDPTTAVACKAERTTRTSRSR